MDGVERYAIVRSEVRVMVDNARMSDRDAISCPGKFTSHRTRNELRGYKGIGHSQRSRCQLCTITIYCSPRCPASEQHRLTTVFSSESGNGLCRIRSMPALLPVCTAGALLAKPVISATGTHLHELKCKVKPRGTAGESNINQRALMRPVV